MALGFFRKKKKPFGKLDEELEDLEKSFESPKKEFKLRETEPVVHEFGEFKTRFGEEERTSAPTIAEHPLREAPLRVEEPSMISKDLEIISSKLDAIKAQIESINQRLANLERIAAAEQSTEKRW